MPSMFVICYWRAVETGEESAGMLFIGLLHWCALNDNNNQQLKMTVLSLLRDSNCRFVLAINVFQLCSWCSWSAVYVYRDTSGQGRFCTIFRSYSRGAQVSVCCSLCMWRPIWLMRGQFILIILIGTGPLKMLEWKTRDHEKYGGGKRGTKSCGSSCRTGKCLNHWNCQ